jgi:hypothetical protein
LQGEVVSRTFSHHFRSIHLIASLHVRDAGLLLLQPSSGVCETRAGSIRVRAMMLLLTCSRKQKLDDANRRPAEHLQLVGRGD